MKPNVKIFISGKITGLNYYYAYQKFSNAEKQLEKQGYKVINPMVKCKRTWPWIRCMAVCLWHLLRSDCIFMLQDWDYSRGAKIEHFIAHYTGKNIIYQKY